MASMVPMVIEFFTTEKINSSYFWSFIPVRDNNSTTSKQKQQQANGFRFRQRNLLQSRFQKWTPVSQNLLNRLQKTLPWKETGFSFC